MEKGITVTFSLEVGAQSFADVVFDALRAYDPHHTLGAKSALNPRAKLASNVYPGEDTYQRAESYSKHKIGPLLEDLKGGERNFVLMAQVSRVGSSDSSGLVFVSAERFMRTFVEFCVKEGRAGQTSDEHVDFRTQAGSMTLEEVREFAQNEGIAVTFEVFHNPPAKLLTRVRETLQRPTRGAAATPDRGSTAAAL